MDAQQIVVQLGIAGLLIVVGFKIAMVFIDRWAKTEDKKTEALTAGFKAIADRVDAHTQLDMASHTALVHAHTETVQAFLRFSADISTRFEALSGLIKTWGTRHDERLLALYGVLELTPPPMTAPTTMPPSNPTPIPRTIAKRQRAQSPRPEDDEGDDR